MFPCGRCHTDGETCRFGCCLCRRGGYQERKEKTMASLSMKEVLNALPPIDVVTLGSMLGVLAACLLLNGTALYLLFRFVIRRWVERLRREEVREHEAAVKQARQSVHTLLELCASLKPAPRHMSPTILEVSRPFMTELLAL